MVSCRGLKTSWDYINKCGFGCVLLPSGQYCLIVPNQANLISQRQDMTDPTVLRLWPLIQCKSNWHICASTQRYFPLPTWQVDLLVLVTCDASRHWHGDEMQCRSRSHGNNLSLSLSRKHEIGTLSIQGRRNSPFPFSSYVQCNDCIYQSTRTWARRQGEPSHNMGLWMRFRWIDSPQRSLYMSALRIYIC